MNKILGNKFYIILIYFMTTPLASYTMHTNHGFLFSQKILQKKQQLVDGFDAIFHNRANVIILDSTLSAAEVTAKALQAILNFIQK